MAGRLVAPPSTGDRSAGSAWPDGKPHPDLAWVGLHRALAQPLPQETPRAEAKAGARPRTEPTPPRQKEGPRAPLIVLCSDGEDVASEVRAARAHNPDDACLVLYPRLDLEAAGAALKSGARGFLHAGMAPEQLARAIEVASGGELAFSRGLIEFLIGKEEAPASSLDGLSARQREILGLVAEGLSNAQIGGTLYLSESTVKQHLRAAYKALGVKNRSQAARIFRRSGASGGG